MNDDIHNKISVLISCVFKPFFNIFEGQKYQQTQANPRGAFAPKIIIFGSWGLYTKRIVTTKNEVLMNMISYDREKAKDVDENEDILINLFMGEIAEICGLK